ncbi:MAG: DUF805 domain-containing protein [Oscillospiraceae bacterium]|nr:DUF805 domain-containing protein [Oscillospiraceae bacterium]
MVSYIRCFGKYAVVRGRSTRMEFWGFTIVNAICWFIIGYFFMKYPRGLANNVMTAITVMYFLLTITPSITVTMRRWHDIGRTGAWVLLNLVPLAGMFTTFGFFLYRGDNFTNKYGRDPYDRKLKRRR